jgi:hypothetical protein
MKIARNIARLKLKQKVDARDANETALSPIEQMGTQNPSFIMRNLLFLSMTYNGTDEGEWFFAKSTLLNPL